MSSIHSENTVFTHLNINSIRNKFELHAELIKGNIDVFLISETKIEDFLIEDFSY